MPAPNQTQTGTAVGGGPKEFDTLLEEPMLEPVGAVAPTPVKSGTSDDAGEAMGGAARRAGGRTGGDFWVSEAAPGGGNGIGTMY